MEQSRRDFLKKVTVGSAGVFMLNKLGFDHQLFAGITNVGGNNLPEDIVPIEAPFDIPDLKRPQFPDNTFSIKDYGAEMVINSKNKNTEAIHKAIEAANKAGGGKVVIPGGEWWIVAIHLKSNVNLHMQEGAEIHFSDEPEDYLPVVFTRWAGIEVMNYSPFIYANGCENIAVTGPGKLYGHGQTWWSWEDRQSKTAWHIYEEQVLEEVPAKNRVYGTPEAGLRPQFISPVNCRNVLLEGFTIAQPGPFWTIHLVYCENIIVRGLTIHTTGGPNLDGINLDSSCDALIEHCQLETGDNPVTLKSGINEDGWRVGKPTENVVVRHNIGLNCPSGVAIGSEMSGGVRNILVHDWFSDGGGMGIRMKSNSARGGFVENIYYRNIKMENLSKEAIIIETDYGAWMSSSKENAYPVFRDIFIEDVVCDGAKVATSILGN
ncbi:MAG: glycoside hydrolase family 28 protein, partial [Bacteroidota bacterium]